MKIKCTIFREQGNSQPMGDQIYHWNTENNHVCEVNDPAHIERLLAIPEAYVCADDQAPAEGEAKAPRQKRKPIEKDDQAPAEGEE